MYGEYVMDVGDDFVEFITVSHGHQHLKIDVMSEYCTKINTLNLEVGEYRARILSTTYDPDEMKLYDKLVPVTKVDIDPDDVSAMIIVGVQRNIDHSWLTLIVVRCSTGGKLIVDKIQLASSGKIVKIKLDGEYPDTEDYLSAGYIDEVTGLPIYRRLSEIPILPK